MKKLLFIALALAVSSVFAEEKSADKKPADKKPAAKAQAQTKASPKAGNGKAAKKPVKSNAFQAYEAGAWKPVNNKKGFLCGSYRIEDGDLRHQPVMVVKFDPDVEVSGDDRESDPKYIYQFMGWEVKVQPHLQVVNVPSRELKSDEIAVIGKAIGKTAAVPGFPCYADFGLEKEPENTEKILPFYYVVDTDGKVIYAGNKGKIAQSAVYGALRKSGEPHPLFGFVKPNVHSNLCASLELGKDATATIAKLKPFAVKGSEESKAEAQDILDALDQTQTYLTKQILATAGQNPPLAVVLATQAAKTFPRNRNFKEIQARAKAAAGQALPVFLKIYEIQAKLAELEAKGEQPKKADLKKWYPIACSAEKKCNSAKKSFGDRLPAAFLRLEDLVQTVKAELEAQGAGEK